MQDSSPNLARAPGRPPDSAILCLAGFMGCGKTTVGMLLARQLAWRFEDLDQRIEHRAQIGIPAIFERLGEPAFRRLEADELTAVLGRSAESREPLVLALGGGTYAQPGMVELLRNSGAVVVWLDCPVERLLSRCALLTNRPLFRDEAGFRDLLAARLPFYRLADHRVEGDDEPARVVERILALPPFARLNRLAQPSSAGGVTP